MGPAESPTYRHSVSVAGVVTDEGGRVLLVRRRDTGEWEPPGGIVEQDEDLLAALVREVREETGITVRPGRLTGVYKNMPLGVVALVFSCTAAGGRLTTGTEAAEVRWTEPAQLRQVVGERLRVRVEDALAAHPDAVIRAYTPARAARSPGPGGGPRLTPHRDPRPQPPHPRSAGPAPPAP